ncbi:polycystin family receptor for egg jelly-like [Tiliqua scincoides]|uniref:polycystin family receptor for egg jelly-like n=1 Tax=Tiliqua scincoides TaxID=71010 RepID=UPI0034629A37
MRCLSLLFLFYGRCCSQFLTATPLLPPPVSITCSKPPTRVYQRQDHKLRISCLWDGAIEMRYSRGPGADSEKERAGLQPPPICRWYRDSILLNNTRSWSGQLALRPGLTGEVTHPPWARSQITIQCVSALCTPPLCLHHNLSIEMAGQDVRLFLLRPRTLPIFEWQRVPLGWCARLKSSIWKYHFRSQGGHPADLLIPSNQHSEPPPFTVYPKAELHQICASYYSYQLTVCYPRRGFYTASLSVEHEPPISLSMDLMVEPALLHVFSGHSKLLSHPHRALSLSWRLLQLSQGIVAYKLVDRAGVGGWSHSYSYNPFSLQSNFCAGPKSRHSEEKVLANIYFRTNEITFGGLTGKLDFSNGTLVFTANSTSPIQLTLNPQKIKVGTYIFNHALGLYYSSQESSATNTTGEGSSSHYIFYQHQSLSYLIVVEFAQQQWYKFSLHMYLNRREALFKALGEKGIEVHVFNGHSPDESLVYVVWFIPAQHPLLQCEWAFSLQLFHSKNQHPIQNYTYAYTDHVRNAAQFIPDSVLPFNPAVYTGFVARVKCTSSGVISVMLKTSINVYASKVIESRVACLEKPCSVAGVRIQRTDPSKHVLHYAHGTEFSLVADTWINCPGPKQTDVIWNIYKVPNITTTPDWSKPIQPPGVGRTNVTTLDVPGSSLNDGLYLFNFTVKLIPMDKRDSMARSDSVFVEIGSDNLVAVISGGPSREIGFSDQWTLDGTGSFKAGAVQPAEGFTFTWYCTKQKMDYVTMTLSEQGRCCPNQVDLKWTASSDPIQMIQPKTLQGNTVYYFRLVVQNHYRTAQAEQVIYIQPDSAPVLNVTCIENCGRSVIPNERFCLSGKCLNCRTRKPLYYWSLLSAHSTEVSFDWSSKTTTGRSNSYLRINAFAFSSMTDQSYVLRLKVITKEGQSAAYEHFFNVHNPPQIGTCVLNPKVGVAFLTKFIIECSGFEDKNEPLTYKVIAAADQMKISTISSLENSPLGIIVYAGHERRTPQSFLPGGTPSQDSALIIYIQVCDAVGACSQLTLQATVHYQMKSKSTDVHGELHGLVNGPRSPMTVLLLTKDYFNLGYFVYMVASALNNIETSPTNQGSKANLRQVLLNMATGIPSAQVQEINQVILSICQITQEITEVNQEAQLLAVRKLEEVSDALRRHRDKDLGSKETEILGQGIFIGLSNVLRASLLNQRKVNIDTVKETISVMEKLADLVLQGKVPGEQETTMKTKDWIIHLWKDENWDISGTFSERSHCKNCFYPKLKQGDPAELPVDAVVSTVLYEFDQNPFPWLLHAADIGTMVTGFQMTGTRSNGDTIRIVPDVVEMVMARTDGDAASFALTIGPDKKLPKTTGGFSFEVKRSSRDVLIQIISKIKVTFHVFVYLNISHPPVALYIASHDSPPALKEVGSKITDCAVKAPYIICLPQSFLWSPTQAYKQADKWNVTIVLQTHPIVSDQTTTVVRIAVFAAYCLQLDGVQHQWKEGTCRLGPQTSYSKIHCVCTPNKHSKRTADPQSTGLSRPGIRFMASKIRLFPSPVDLKVELLVKTGRNLIPLWTVLTIFINFIVLAVWAIRKDRKVVIRDPIIDLPDNDPFHKVGYLVTIYTGNCCGAGTAADVFIRLIGQAGVSDVHQLKHPRFPKILQRGSVHTFLLTTKEDLGDIFSLHVWHNNSGYFSSWYLSRVKVQNLATQQSWLFMCRKWLALGQGDGQIERTFTATDPAAPLRRIDYFLITVANDLFKNHLWLSLFAREKDNSFSTFQRVSCCFTILLSLLMINTLLIIFTTTENSAVLHYRQTVIYGLESTFFSVPLQLIVISLFKYSKEKPSQYNTAQPEEDSTLPSDRLGNEGDPGDVSPSKVKLQALPPAATNSSQKNAAEKEPFYVKTRRVRLCWWCRYVAWVFVFVLSVTSSFITIFYGLSYTYGMSLEWLIACIVSAFQHIFVQQTLKTVWLSAFGSIFTKDSGSIQWSSYKGKKPSGRTMTADEMVQLHNELVRVRASKRYQPLGKDEVAIMRKIHRVKFQAYMFTKDLVCHFVFLSLILIWSDSSETTSSFYYNQHIRSKFSFGLSKVDKTEDIYTWMRDVFLPLIHNDYQPTYISETWSKILGLPRMRQIRAKDMKKDCFQTLYLIRPVANKTHCHHLYGIDPEDQADYLGSWTMPANHPVSRTYNGFLGFTYEQSAKDWDYDSHGELYSYPARGYSFYFFPKEPQVNSTERLADLETNQWLDDHSWAVILELTAFNPDADLFCSISVIFEFSYLGFLNRSLSVHSYKLPIFSQQTKMQFFVFVVIIVMLIIYIVDECWVLHQERTNYFKAAANLINFGLKTICVSVILLHIAKFLIAVKILQFYLHHSEEFTPFHKASNLDRFVKNTIGFLVFFLILKTYRYFRFMYDVRLAQKTLFAALPTLLNLSIAGGIFFFAFVSFGYLVFGQHEWNYRKMVYSFTTILSYCTMAFRHTEFASAKTLAGFFLAAFMLVMVCVVVNLSHVIFISAYTEMKELGSKEHSHEAETMYLVIQKIYRMLFSALYGTEPKTETDIFNTVLYGKPTRKNDLENIYRKINRNHFESPQISDKNLV